MALVFIGAPVNAEAPIEEQAVESPFVVEQYVEYVPPKPLPKIVSPKRISSVCSCLQYFKNRRGITQRLFYPNRMSPASQTPFIGAGVLLSEGSVGHIAVVEKIEAGRIYVSETNYYRCRYSERWINLDYWAIRGYY